MVAAEHTASTRRVYWHGGAPGLLIGERLLPPAVTGTQVTLGTYMGEEGKAPAGYRADRVYVTALHEAAELYATLYPGGGWVYLVEPEGELVADPDYTEAGVSFACTAARIVEVHLLDLLTICAILTAVEAGGAA